MTFFFSAMGLSRVMVFTMTCDTLKICKICMQWILLRLIPDQKVYCFIMCLQMLKCNNRENDDFFEQLHVFLNMKNIKFEYIICQYKVDVVTYKQILTLQTLFSQEIYGKHWYSIIVPLVL